MVKCDEVTTLPIRTADYGEFLKLAERGNLRSPRSVQLVKESTILVEDLVKPSSEKGVRFSKTSTIICATVISAETHGKGTME